LFVSDAVAETLPEPVRLRSTEAEEHREISEFQAELVQLGAVLNGDGAKDVYDNDKLIEGMTVAAGAEYCHDAFRRFTEECERCQERGMDGSHIPTVVQPAASFASKLCGCLPCFKA
jgi:phospholipase C